jgi:hypothetical protein
MNITRRTAIALMGAAAVPSAAVASVALATSKRTDCPMVRVAAAIQNLKEAMHDAYGVWPDDTSNIDHWSGQVVCLSITEPVHQRKVKWFLDDEGPLLPADRMDTMIRRREV